MTSAVQLVGTSSQPLVSGDRVIPAVFSVSKVVENNKLTNANISLELCLSSEISLLMMKIQTTGRVR